MVGHEHYRVWMAARSPVCRIEAAFIVAGPEKAAVAPAAPRKSLRRVPAFTANGCRISERESKRRLANARSPGGDHLSKARVHLVPRSIESGGVVYACELSVIESVVHLPTKL